MIVTTTVNAPTAAIRAYARMENWTLLVVGDLKTPADYSVPGATYMSPAEQASAWPELSELLGWNCIQRRNLGFIRALEMGATCVATIDDDNIPLPNWGSAVSVGQEVKTSRHEVALVGDPLWLTEHKHLWHRGFPIQMVGARQHGDVSEAIVRADVEAYLWNGDPDVDAACRMIYAPNVEFRSSIVPVSFSGFSPFNSQNTIVSTAALRHYFMFPEIGRMDDIWGAYYLEAQNFNVVYREATVRQDRNMHDLTRDFENEIVGYLHTLELLHALRRKGPMAIHDFLPSRASEALHCYETLAAGL